MSNPALVLEYRRLLACVAKSKLLGREDRWFEQHLAKLKTELINRHLEIKE
jgi:hypothetical protein